MRYTDQMRTFDAKFIHMGKDRHQGVPTYRKEAISRSEYKRRSHDNGIGKHVEYCLFAKSFRSEIWDSAYTKVS